MWNFIVLIPYHCLSINFSIFTNQKLSLQVFCTSYYMYFLPRLQFLWADNHMIICSHVFEIRLFMTLRNIELGYWRLTDAS